MADKPEQEVLPHQAPAKTGGETPVSDTFIQRMRKRIKDNPKTTRVVGGVFALILLFCILFGSAFIGRVPNVAVTATPIQGLTGSTMITTFQQMINAERKDWLPNNWVYRRIWDNHPNFQMGQLRTWQTFSFTLMDNLTRYRGTDKINTRMEAVKALLNNDPTLLIMPGFRGKMKEAVGALKSYQDQLKDGEVRYPVRVDNLKRLARDLGSLLGSLQKELLLGTPEARNSPLKQKESSAFSQNDFQFEFQEVEVNSGNGDGLFYHAKGVAAAAYTILSAAQYEYRDALAKKESQELMIEALFFLKICAEMDKTLLPVSNFSLSFGYNNLATMAAPLGYARQKLREIVDMLENT